MSPKSILAYGFDLGHHGTTQLKEADRWGGLTGVAWHDPERNHSVIAQAEIHLLTTAGVQDADLSYDRDDLLKEDLGVWFETYGWDGEPNYVLAAYTVDVDWEDDAKPIDFRVLAKQVLNHDLDAKLASALETLGVTPKQEQPSWLLCAHGD